MRIAGRDGPDFLGIGVEALAWSPDGRRLAYPARTKEGWTVVVQEANLRAGAGERPGVQATPYDGIGEIVWSADSQHLAYAAERKGRWLVVAGAREGATFESLRSRSLRISADGAHHAYAADDDGRVVVVVDGVKSAPHEAIGQLSLRDDGLAVFAARTGDRSAIVIGSVVYGPYEDVAEVSISPHGREVGWTARSGGGWRVHVQCLPPTSVRGGEPCTLPGSKGTSGPSGQSPGPSGQSPAREGAWESEAFARVGGLVWAPRTGALAFAVGVADGERVIADGVEGRLFEGVLPGSLRWDAGGTVVAYAGRRNRAWYVVQGASESEPYEEVEPPVFLGGTRATAFLARRGAASFIVADGHQGPVVADATELSVSPDGWRFLHLSRDGARVAVAMGEVRAVGGGECGEGRCRPEVTRTVVQDVVIGGTLRWSGSSKHSGYLAGDSAARRLFLVVDGERRGDFDMLELMGNLSLSPDLSGALTGDSERLGEWVRAEVELAERSGLHVRGRRW
ncbi:MAG: hypothetical protein R3B70_11455 [Polyangiaceae bacterium]